MTGPAENRAWKGRTAGVRRLGLVAAASGPARAAGDIAVGDATSRVTPAGAPTGIGTMTISNGGSAPDRLIAATLPAADRVEIHEMAVDDGVMTMRPVPGGLAIPAHGRMVLRPASYHLMPIGPRAPLIPTFEKTGCEEVELAVQPMGTDPPMKGKASP